MLVRVAIIAAWYAPDSLREMEKWFLDIGDVREDDAIGCPQRR